MRKLPSLSHVAAKKSVRIAGVAVLLAIGATFAACSASSSDDDSRGDALGAGRNAIPYYTKMCPGAGCK